VVRDAVATQSLQPLHFQISVGGTTTELPVHNCNYADTDQLMNRFLKLLHTGIDTLIMDYEFRVFCNKVVFLKIVQL
jgi:hypothetical protein